MPATNTPLRLGVIGCGSMGQAAHLEHYARNPGCTVVALAELRPQLRTAVAARWGVPHAYADHRELLAAGHQLDALVAIQPFTLHGQLLPELLATGLPLLCEKPLARSSEAAQAIRAAEVAHPGARVAIAYHKRCDPATEWLRARLDALNASGELGRLRYLRLTMPPGDWQAGGLAGIVRRDDPPFREAVTWDAPPAGFTPTAAAAHESFVNYYIHQVNLLRHLLGADYQLVHADSQGLTLQVATASGVVGLLEMAPFVSTRDWQESALVCYERGWLRLDLPAPLVSRQPGRVTVFEDPGQGLEPRTWSPVLPPISAMERQADRFLAFVRGEPTQLCGTAEAVADLALADAYIRRLHGGGAA